jgi:hypothetical protein
MFTRWRLGPDFQDELVVGGSLLVGDGELVLVADVFLLQVVDRQSDRVLAGKILKNTDLFC